MVISVSLFLIINPLSKQTSSRQFYLGVEFAYSNQFSDLKALVDKVKSYTNLIIVGDLGISFNRTALDESVDYINASGLNFIVLFTGLEYYNSSNGYPPNNSIFDWMKATKQKYGDRFLGIYRFDEPGGNQLDATRDQIINDSAGGLPEVSQNYVGNLSAIVNYYRSNSGGLQIFTSDYGLYWFDYAASYDTVFGEFVGAPPRFGGNETLQQSKQEVIALDRGAADSFNKNWGIIITWQENYAPYLENGAELYSDLAQAYCTGASYAIVFSYPNVTAYGTLTDEHFAALQKFWSDIHQTGIFSPSKATVAYVLPKDYGFGFRYNVDNIWGLTFPTDTYSSRQKIWNDTTYLVAKFGNTLNIIFDDPAVIGSTLNQYSKVYYWDQNITD